MSHRCDWNCYDEHGVKTCKQQALGASTIEPMSVSMTSVELTDQLNSAIAILNEDRTTLEKATRGLLKAVEARSKAQGDFDACQLEKNRAQIEFDNSAMSLRKLLTLPEPSQQESFIDTEIDDIGREG